MNTKIITRVNNVDIYHFKTYKYEHENYYKSEQCGHSCHQ